MTWNELNQILDALDHKVRSDYEQTRLLVHSIYQVNSTKKLNTTDIIKFPWDKEEDFVDQENIMSKEDAEKLINRKQ